MATHSRQMSDAFRTTVFLTLSGGFQDAYTYMGRGKVFANAQTGNIVLMATNFCEGDFAKALRYLLPLLAFAAGVYFAEGIRNRYHLMSSRSFKGSLQFVKEHAAGLLQERKDRFAQLKAERKNKKA